MKITKGDWKLHGLVIETDYSPNGHVIATMNDIGDNVQGDAHLMVTAPKLYESVKELLALSVGCWRHGRPEFVKARQALNEAEGKEEVLYGI